jgi:hypothetical protein
MVEVGLAVGKDHRESGGSFRMFASGGFFIIFGLEGSVCGVGVNPGGFSFAESEGTFGAGIGALGASVAVESESQTRFVVEDFEQILEFGWCLMLRVLEELKGGLDEEFNSLAVEDGVAGWCDGWEKRTRLLTMIHFKQVSAGKAESQAEGWRLGGQFLDFFVGMPIEPVEELGSLGFGKLGGGAVWRWFTVAHKK